VYITITNEQGKDLNIRNNFMDRSMIERVLLFFISVSLPSILLGCGVSSHPAKEADHRNAYVADVKLFDDLYNLFSGKHEEVSKQSEERRYYLVGNENVRLVSIADSEEHTRDVLAYVSVTDIRGQPYTVSRAAMVDPRDIEALYVEKSLYKGNEQYIIVLLFKQDSWDRVHHATERLRGRRLALIKNEKVLSAPVVMEPVVEAAGVSGKFEKSDIQWFVQGLTPTEPPSVAAREKDLVDWLERRVEKYPNETSSIVRLAKCYTKIGKSVCKKASGIYERAIQLDPARSIAYFLPFLHSCFEESGNYDRAITFYNELIDQRKKPPLEEVYIRGALAEAYFQKGSIEQAVHELEEAVSVVKSFTPQFPEGSKHKAEIESAKAKMVQSIEREISRMKSQGPMEDQLPRQR
jgi:tetratricopeptide (TPR) repeat protein